MSDPIDGGGQPDIIDFRAMLEQNYDELWDPRCKEAVVNFIRMTESVSEYDAIFIKKLSKVTLHIYHQDPACLDGFLRRIIRFHEEGIDNIPKLDPDLHHQYDLLTLYSHMLGYAADFFVVMFKKSGDLGYALKAHGYYKTSAEASFEIEPLHSSHSISFAGSVSKRILYALNATGEASLQERLLWAVEQYECERKSGDLAAEAEPLHAAYSYNFAGTSASDIFNMIKTSEDFSLEEKIIWALRIYENKKDASELFRLTKPDNAVIGYGAAAEAANLVIGLLSRKGASAREMMRWEEKRYLCYLASADMKQNEPEAAAGAETAHLYSFAGDAAESMYELTRRKEWAKKAIRCYRRLIRQYEDTNDPSLLGIASKLARSVDRLKMPGKEKERIARRIQQKEKQGKNRERMSFHEILAGFPEIDAIGE